MISSRHRSEDIHQFLLEFRYSCEDVGVWPVCERICIDVSNALLIGINRAFNYTATTVAYVDKCYEILTSGKEPHFIVTQFCVNHFSHIIATFINEKTGKENIRKFFKEIMAYALTLNNLEDVRIWWSNFVIIFESKKQNDKLHSAFENIRAKILNTEKSTLDITAINEVTLKNKEFFPRQPYSCF